MGEAKRTIIVHIFDDKDEPHGVDFGMSGYGVRHDEIRCSKDKAKRGLRRNKPHEVVFEIANRSSKDLLFPSDKKRAMWVSNDGTSCPTSQPANEHAVVKAVKVSDDREQLFVENANPKKESFKFALNFVDAADASESQLIPFDPVWANQNGGQQ